MADATLKPLRGTLAPEESNGGGCRVGRSDRLAPPRKSILNSVHVLNQIYISTRSVALGRLCKNLVCKPHQSRSPAQEKIAETV